MTKARKISIILLCVLACLSCFFTLKATEKTASAEPTFISDGTITDPTNYDYSFAVIGDTQCLLPSYANFKLGGIENQEATIEWEGVTYNPVSYDGWKYFSHDTFVKIYDYVLNNADSKNIAHCFGLGDMTERAEVWDWVQSGCPYAPDEEFALVQEQIKRMNGVVDYSLARGNHETLPMFDKYFGTGEKASESGYSELVDEVYVHPDGFIDYSNTVHYFSAGELDYMVVTLDYGASDDILNWASKKISEHPYKNVIITTHSYLTWEGNFIDNNTTNPKMDRDRLVYNRANINNGKDMWDDLISQHPNIVLALCGHEVSEDIVVRQDAGVNGNIVTSMLIDPQQMDIDLASTGGVGAVAMFYMSNGGKNAELRYWSTARNAYLPISTPSVTLHTVDADYTVLNKLISELPEINSLTKLDAIKVNEAKAIFNAMTDTNKQKVVNAGKLTQAISKINELATDHTVTWIVDGQNYTTTAKYGDMPTFTDNTFVLGKEFTGWSPALSPVTENVTYTAQYSNTSVWNGSFPSIKNGYTLSGAGTQSNPWLIQSATDLAALSALSSGKDYGSANEYYKLTVDIDLSASDWQPICNDLESLDNKWTTWYKFGANFDGDNHTITLNTYTHKFAYGLFGAISGTVSNLTIAGNLTTPGYDGAGYNGALASKVYTGATFTNITNKVNIVSNGNQVGGLIGNAENEAVVTFTNCHNQGNITSNNGGYVGGLLGGGWASIKFNNCSNSGAITGTTNVGGLIGELWLQGEVKNSTNTGIVKASNLVATETNGNNTTSFVGQLIGKDNLSPVTNTVSVWDGTYPDTTSGYTFEGLGTSASPYLIQSATDLAALSKISRVSKGNTYGTGVYYKLTTNIDMSAGIWIPISYAYDRSGSNWGWGFFGGSFDGDGHTIIISSDISSTKTADGLTLQTYGYGLFEGLNGATVKNLTLQGSMKAGNRVGAVAYIAKADNGASTITNVKNCINITATVNDGWVAGLLGTTSGILNITNCYNYGSVNGLEKVGGLVGDTYGTVTFTNCANEGIINGTNYVGGLMGCVNSGSVTINNCSSVKTIAGTSFVGQFIGANPNNTQKVTFVVDGVSTNINFGYGTDPSFNGTPTKVTDAQYIYTFTGWDKELSPVLSNITYTAVFSTELRSYNVTWIVDETISTETYNYGETPVYNGTLTKNATAQYSYSFKCWDEEIVAVVGDATYTAQFNQIVNEYTVTWIVEGLEHTTQVKYGNKPVFGSTPTKNATSEYTFTFVGWATEENGSAILESELPEITANGTLFYAVFTQTPIQQTSNSSVSSNSSTSSNTTVSSSSSTIVSTSNPASSSSLVESVIESSESSSNASSNISSSEISTSSTSSINTSSDIITSQPSSESVNSSSSKPLQNSSKQSSTEKNGCGSSIDGTFTTFALIALLGSIALITKKSKKN